MKVIVPMCTMLIADSEWNKCNIRKMNLNGTNTKIKNKIQFKESTTPPKKEWTILFKIVYHIQ